MLQPLLSPAARSLGALLLLATGMLPAQAPAPDDEAFEECSVGVAAGRATADGRPLLWKNRDSQAIDNVLRRFDDGRFPYVALCSAGSTRSVWGGANAAGFCIMNSLSRDLTGDSEKGPSNGPFMKLALQRCATVEEFEDLLEQTDDSGRRTHANFGVIDASGGAAIFETGHHHFVRFDAADTEAGILVRTNFATTADGDRGKERFDRAGALCFERSSDQPFDHRYLLQRFCRDLQAPPCAVQGPAGLRDVRETIHRQTTVASIAFHGVKDGEDPRLTTMWSVLGQPLFAVAVPAWPAADLAPEVRAAPRSALCDAALRLKSTFYVHDPQAEIATETELPGDVRWLRTAGLEEQLRAVLEVENEILADTAAELLDWREAIGPGALPAAQAQVHARQVQRALHALRQFAAARREHELVRLIGRIEGLDAERFPVSLVIDGDPHEIEQPRFDLWLPRADTWHLRLAPDGHQPTEQTPRVTDARDGVLTVTLSPSPRPTSPPVAPNGARHHL